MRARGESITKSDPGEFSQSAPFEERLNDVRPCVEVGRNGPEDVIVPAPERTKKVWLLVVLRALSAWPC
jgi:hypothetical protein